MNFQLLASIILGVTLVSWLFTLYSLTYIEEGLILQRKVQKCNCTKGQENLKEIGLENKPSFNISRIISINRNSAELYSLHLQRECECEKLGFVANEVLINGIPISKYQISEVDVESNLENKDWFLNKILLFANAVAALERLEDFVPGIVANTLFGGLVSLVRQFPKFSISEILQHPEILAVQSKVIKNSGIAEYYLEVLNARNIILGEIRLEEFIYFKNYRLLMKFEAECIRGYLGSSRFDQIKEVVFIGSGPMPLSSIELLQHLPQNASIVNYDQLDEAIELGQGLVASQNLSHRISFVKAGALNVPDLSKADVVYLAALVGNSTDEKKRILIHIQRIMKPNSLIVARSATGLRTLLYQRLTAADLPLFQSFQEFNPENKVIINSVALAMKTRESG